MNSPVFCPTTGFADHTPGKQVGVQSPGGPPLVGERGALVAEGLEQRQAQAAHVRHRRRSHRQGGAAAQQLLHCVAA